MRILAFAASLRQGSFNRRLLERAVSHAREAGADVSQVDFGELVCPYFNADLQERDGIPAPARQLGEAIRQHDGLLIASPEYNYSMPGTLKNTIDWVSRIRPLPFLDRTAFLMGASNGPIGTNRGLWQVRIPLECLGVAVYPRMFGLPNGGGAFAADGSLADTKNDDRLRSLVGKYLEFGRALAGTEPLGSG